ASSAPMAPSATPRWPPHSAFPWRCPIAADLEEDCSQSPTMRGLTIGVPGQMRALKALLKVTRSRIPWSGLFDEAIKLAEDGFVVREHLAAAIYRNKDILTKEPFRNIYANVEGEHLKAGDTLRQPTLAQTLRDMAKSAEQGDFFYKGKMARDMVADIRQEGSLMTEDDMAAYIVRTVTPLRFPLGNGHVLWSPSPPAGGALVGIVLGVLSKFLDGERLPDNVNTTHRLVEALKFAFGRRGDLGDTPSSELEKALQDPHLLEGIAANITEQPVQDVRHYGEHFWSRMDKGTAQLGIMAANGDAVVMATSLNSERATSVRSFGARVLSKRTGVLFNDVLNDFDLPNVKNQYGLPSSTANQLEPNKRPLSSLAPSLVLRNKKVVVGVSASGGGYIVSSIA
ncbi:hypothetical protein HPB47_001051, partial [Ixodes persulcatus]